MGSYRGSGSREEGGIGTTIPGPSVLLCLFLPLCL